MSTVLVRLRPHDKRRGHVLRRFTAYSMRFQESKGWYEVEEEVAKLLGKFKQPPTGNMPADMCESAFEVKTQEAALVQEEVDRKAREARALAISPNRMETSEAAGTLTTPDLPANQPAPKPRKKAKTRSSRQRDKGR